MNNLLMAEKAWQANRNKGVHGITNCRKLVYCKLFDEQMIAQQPYAGH